MLSWQERFCENDKLNLVVLFFSAIHTFIFFLSTTLRRWVSRRMADERACVPFISALSAHDTVAQQAKSKGNEVFRVMDYLFQTRFRSADVDFHVARQRN